MQKSHPHTPDGDWLLFVFQKDSAEKPFGMLRQAQHARKFLIVINPLPVRPELRRRVNGGFSAESKRLPVPFNSRQSKSLELVDRNPEGTGCVKEPAIVNGNGDALPPAFGETP
jgi:hypothetical protein